MSTYENSERDWESLIGTLTSPEYSFQQKVQELRESNDQQDDQLETQIWDETEELAWSGARTINGVLIKKACEHASCNHFRCERARRLGGIEI